MIPQFLSNNVTSWAVQVVIVAFIAALLPVLLRIRHARSRLAYCHIVLAVCAALPIVQPWQHSLVFAPAGFTGPISTADADPDLSPAAVLLWTLAAGVFVRLAWLSLGLYRIRRYRRSAVPLSPLPDSIRSARQLAGADAGFRLCEGISSPATLGHIDPIVLLPVSFTSLDSDAQRGIAVHELLHVRRSDWRMTVVEEVLAALLWFSPGIWWLLAQARLSREELVDAEVVRLTAAAPYINALLSMAGIPASRRLAPAALFFTKQHLTQRLASLLLPRCRSKLRLVLCYGTMALLVAGTGGASFIWFPITGRTDLVLMASAAPALPSAKALQPLRVAPIAFDVRVPAPPAPLPEIAPFGTALPGPAGDVFFVRAIAHTGLSAPRDLPLLPPAGFSGIRAIRPGDVVPPEEIRRILATLPPGQNIEITQDSMNTVLRVVVGRTALRRADHVIHLIPSDVPVDPAGADAPTANTPTDGID